MLARPVAMVVVTLGALVTMAAPARAQYPGGGGRGGRGGYSQNGIPQSESLPAKPDAGPKSEELIDMKPMLRGIKLTALQDSAIKSINERYEPQLLPMYDWLRDQRDRRQKGLDVDMALVQKRFDRVIVLRQKQLADIRVLLTAEQQVRWDRNADDDRQRAAESAPLRVKP